MPSPEFLPNPSKKSHLKPFCRKRKNRLGGVACGLSLDTLGANFGLRRPIFPLLRGIRVGCLAGDAHGIEPDVAVLLGNDETPALQNGSLTIIPFMISNLIKAYTKKVTASGFTRFVIEV
jgi:hypothetical protein